MASLFESLGINDEEQQAAPVKPEKAGVLRTMGDQVLSLGQGVVGGVKMLSDLAGPDNAVSQTLGEANTSMQGMFSAGRAEEMKNRQALIDAADDGDSTLDQITTRLGGIKDAPMQTFLEAMGSMAPNIAAALATGGVSAGPGLVALAARFGVPAALGVGMGVGSVKGQNYEAVFNKAKQEGLSDDEAVSLGIKASEYSAQNAPQQALGGALGMLDSLTGAERMITGMTRKAGAEVAAKPAQGLMKRTLLGASEEAPAEGLQGAQGQYAQNEALNNAGFTTNPWSGVAGAGINDAVVGAMVGGPMGALHNPARQAPVITPQQAEADAIRATELVPEAGAMTRAANVGTEAKARAVESAPPITPEDVFAQELAATQDDIRQSSTLQKIRDSASPTLGVTTDEFLAALGVAGDASARTDLRRMALDNIQGAVEHFKTGANLVPDVPQAPGTELATLNERATGMAEVNPAPEFDPNTMDGQTRFVDELGSQRAIGGPRALTYDDPAPDAPPPSRQAVPQLQAGDIQNKLGKPFTNLFAAKNVSREAGSGYAPVKLGENAFVVRKVDAEQNKAPDRIEQANTAIENVAVDAGEVAPKAESTREQAIANASNAAKDVLTKGGTEADANRAATDSLIGQMAANPDIRIAIDAPAAVKSAKQQAAAPTAPAAIETATTATEQADSQHIGRDNKPLSEGGKPFKTRDEASAARKLQPMLRVVKSPTGKGFALAPKTEAQLAAQDKAAKRLSLARTGKAGVPTAAHEFIAGAGGMDADKKTEFSFGNNPRVGNRTLFAGARGGMSIEAATEKLIEARYLPAGASHSDTVALINRSFTQPQYTVDGAEVMAEAAHATRFEDHLAAQQEAAQNDNFDPFAPLTEQEYTAADMAGTGYAQASAEIQQEVAALSAQLDAMGIDAEAIRMDIDTQNPQATNHEYYELTKAAITSAINEQAAVTRGRGDTGQNDGKQGQPAPGREGQEAGLTAPSRAEILAQQERTDTATKADAAQRRAQDLTDKRERERKDIAKASEAAADTFVLGGDAEQNLSGQKDIFGGSEFTPPVSKTETTPVAETPGADELRAEAAAILDAANITGKERIDVLKDVKKGDITTEELEAAYPAKESASKFASDGVGRSEAEKELQAQSHEKEAPGDVLMANGRFVAFDAVVKMAREGIATGEIRPAPAQMHVKLDMSMRDADRVLKAATEARKAAQPADAAHAQDLTYTAASKIDTPAQGELSNAKEQKERAFERLKNLRSQVNDGRSDLRLELIKAESAHKDALRRVSNAQDQIEKDANKQGLTTIKPKQAEQGAAMFSRRESSVLSKDGKFKGWPKFNAWTRQEYSDVVSLLPDAYRNDAHRREPVAAKDWDALAAAVLPELEALNNAAGEGAFRLDPLGNIIGDVRRYDSSVFASELVDIANRHDLGIFLTGLRTSSMAPLAEMGFTPEMGLGAILVRATGSTAPVMPMASGTINNTAYGTMMSYRPRGFAAPMFSKAESGASQQPTRGTPVPRVQAVVDAITAHWANAPEVVVVSDMQDAKVPQKVREADQLQKSQGAQGEPDGFIYKGTVYLVASELPTINDVVRVLMHESLGHSGLRGAFGDALKPILSQVANYRRADIVKKAREYGLLNPATLRGASVNEQWQAMTEKNRQVAAEEVLAVMAEKHPELGFVKRAVSAIRNWLRANVPGFKSLAMTDADIVQAFILPARRHIEGKQAKVSMPENNASLAALSRSQDQTDPDIRYSRATVARNSWDGPEASGFDDLVYKLQDKQIDTKRVVEAIKAKSSVLADEKNVYLQEELFHGRAAARTEDFVNKELGPLVNMMKMRGIDIPMLDEHLHARHAEEANKLIADRNKLPNAGQLDATGNVIESPLQDGGSGMTTQAARDYLAKLTPAERTRLDAVAAKVDDILANTRQLYADYDLESQDKVDGWGTMFKHYVPLMREDKDGGMGIGQGFSIKGKEVKGRTGSTRKVVDILANIALQRERAIVRGEKNRVATALVGLVKLNPNKEFWHVGPPPAQKVYDPDSNSVVERQDPMYKSRDNVVVAKIKGKDGSVSEQAVTFNEGDARAVRMASALKNLDAAQLEGLLGVSAKITRYFAAINTQYNPIFGTVNLVRDVQGALFNLSSTPLKGRAMEIARYTMSALKGIYLDARAARNGKTPSSQWATLWEEFQDEGGQTGFRDLFANSADRAKAIERELNPTAWMDGPLGKVFTANGALKVPLTVAQKKATGMFDWLSDYNLAMENAVRLAAYKVAKEQGISKQQSASLGKNLTVNFNRKGQVGQQAGALYAFFNASMQGTARLGQTLFDMEPGKPKTLRMSATGKKIVYGGVLLGAMQALLLAAAGFDDEEPPDFVRERSLIIPTGGKTYITIPMPLGLHVLPNMGRIPMEFAMGGGKDPAQHVAKILGLLAGSFNPIGGGVSLVQMLAPTAIDPLVAIAENKDWTGKPIAKTAYNKATPGHLLAKDTATYPAKVLAEAINIMSGGTEYTAGVLSPTPDQIDYLFGQVTGGVGREASKLQQSASAIYSGEDLPVHKVPLVGRFYGDTDTQSAQSGKFYSAINKLNVHEAEIKGLRKDGRGAEAAKYIQENPDSRLFVAANFAEREVQKLRAAKRALITKGAPADEVKAVETRINDRMTRFNQTVQRLREKSAA